MIAFDFPAMWDEADVQGGRDVAAEAEARVRNYNAAPRCELTDMRELECAHCLGHVLDPAIEEALTPEGELR